MTMAHKNFTTKFISPFCADGDSIESGERGRRWRRVGRRQHCVLRVGRARRIAVAGGGGGARPSRHDQQPTNQQQQ